MWGSGISAHQDSLCDLPGHEAFQRDAAGGRKPCAGGFWNGQGEEGGGRGRHGLVGNQGLCGAGAV